MNIINLRKNLRRLSKTRRISDRRTIPYEFGSPEWEEHIKSHYLVWPKKDRRLQERRANERRIPDRRNNQVLSSPRSRFEKKYARILLTPEERKLIEDMYLKEID